jgi:hypothetical protein
VPKRKSTKSARPRKRTAKVASVPATPAALTYTPWDSPETLAGVKEETAKVAGWWHFIAA